MIRNIQRSTFQEKKTDNIIKITSRKYSSIFCTKLLYTKSEKNEGKTISDALIIWNPINLNDIKT